LLAEWSPGGRFVLATNFPLKEFEKTFTALGQALAEYEGWEW
jgi:hypothetical protein